MEKTMVVKAIGGLKFISKRKIFSGIWGLNFYCYYTIQICNVIAIGTHHDGPSRSA